MRNQRINIIIISIGIVLLIPFIAMQFTNEVNWSLSDFLIMGILLCGTGLLIEIAMRRIKSFKNRVIICGAILFVFILIWVELAVGIFDTPFAGS